MVKFTQLDVDEAKKICTEISSVNSDIKNRSFPNLMEALEDIQRNIRSTELMPVIAQIISSTNMIQNSLVSSLTDLENGLENYIINQGQSNEELLDRLKTALAHMAEVSDIDTTGLQYIGL